MSPDYVPPPIVGYRTLSELEIDLMNEGKTLASSCGEFVAKLRAMEECDQRWVSIGATDVQQGFMALLRAIARPTTF
jgi:hypothetical protein